MVIPQEFLLLKTLGILFTEHGLDWSSTGNFWLQQFVIDQCFRSIIMSLLYHHKTWADFRTST